METAPPPVSENGIRSICCTCGQNILLALDTQWMNHCFLWLGTGNYGWSHTWHCHVTLDWV